MTIFEFVTEKHKGQKRKYTEEPYINHLIRVASNFEKDSYLYNLALCHDLFEDTDCTHKELIEIVKINVDSLKFDNKQLDTIVIIDFMKDVDNLTDYFTAKKYPNLNRKYRKTGELGRMSHFSKEAMTVKYADLIDNCDIVLYDKSFGKIYLQEKYEILKHCQQGNFDLYYKAIVKHNEMIKLL